MNLSRYKYCSKILLYYFIVLILIGRGDAQCPNLYSQTAHVGGAIAITNVNVAQVPTVTFPGAKFSVPTYDATHTSYILQMSVDSKKRALDDAHLPTTLTNTITIDILGVGIQTCPMTFYTPKFDQFSPTNIIPDVNDQQLTLDGESIGYYLPILPPIVKLISISNALTILCNNVVTTLTTLTCDFNFNLAVNIDDLYVEVTLPPNPKPYIVIKAIPVKKQQLIVAPVLGVAQAPTGVALTFQANDLSGVNPSDITINFGPNIIPFTFNDNHILVNFNEDDIVMDGYDVKMVSTNGDELFSQNGFKFIDPIITDVIPDNGALTGGYDIEIIGSGLPRIFKPHITIGDVECVIQTFNENKIVCHVQENTKATDVFNINVQVFAGTNTIVAPKQFTYNRPIIPPTQKLVLYKKGTVELAGDKYDSIPLNQYSVQIAGVPQLNPNFAIHIDDTLHFDIDVAGKPTGVELEVKLLAGGIVLSNDAKLTIEKLELDLLTPNRCFYLNPHVLKFKPLFTAAFKIFVAGTEFAATNLGGGTFEINLPAVNNPVILPVEILVAGQVDKVKVFDFEYSFVKLIPNHQKLSELQEFLVPLQFTGEYLSEIKSIVIGDITMNVVAAGNTPQECLLITVPSEAIECPVHVQEYGKHLVSVFLNRNGHRYTIVTSPTTRLHIIFDIPEVTKLEPNKLQRITANTGENIEIHYTLPTSAGAATVTLEKPNILDGTQPNHQLCSAVSAEACIVSVTDPTVKNCKVDCTKAKGEIGYYRPIVKYTDTGVEYTSLANENMEFYNFGPVCRGLWEDNYPPVSWSFTYKVGTGSKKQKDNINDPYLYMDELNDQELKFYSGLEASRAPKEDITNIRILSPFIKTWRQREDFKYIAFNDQPTPGSDTAYAPSQYTNNEETNKPFEKAHAKGFVIYDYSEGRAYGIHVPISNPKFPKAASGTQWVSGNDAIYFDSPDVNQYFLCYQFDDLKKVTTHLQQSSIPMYYPKNGVAYEKDTVSQCPDSTGAMVNCDEVYGLKDLKKSDKADAFIEACVEEIDDKITALQAATTGPDFVNFKNEQTAQLDNIENSLPVNLVPLQGYKTIIDNIPWNKGNLQHCYFQQTMTVHGIINRKKSISGHVYSKPTNEHEGEGTEPLISSYNKIYSDITQPWELIIDDIPKNGKQYVKKRLGGIDLWEVIATRYLNKKMFVNTWLKSSKPHMFTPSNLAQVGYLSFPIRLFTDDEDDVYSRRIFDSDNDHSKIMIPMYPEFGANKYAANENMFCVGDSNRHTHQDVRGGGIVCLQLPELVYNWHSFVRSYMTRLHNRDYPHTKKDSVMFRCQVNQKITVDVDPAIKWIDDTFEIRILDAYGHEFYPKIRITGESDETHHLLAIRTQTVANAEAPLEPKTFIPFVNNEPAIMNEVAPSLYRTYLLAYSSAFGTICEGSYTSAAEPVCNKDHASIIDLTHLQPASPLFPATDTKPKPINPETGADFAFTISTALDPGVGQMEHFYKVQKIIKKKLIPTLGKYKYLHDPHLATSMAFKGGWIYFNNANCQDETIYYIIYNRVQSVSVFWPLPDWIVGSLIAISKYLVKVPAVTCDFNSLALANSINTLLNPGASAPTFADPTGLYRTAFTVSKWITDDPTRLIPIFEKLGSSTDGSLSDFYENHLKADYGATTMKSEMDTIFTPVAVVSLKAAKMRPEYYYLDNQSPLQSIINNPISLQSVSSLAFENVTLLKKAFDRWTTVNSVNQAIQFILLNPRNGINIEELNYMDEVSSFGSLINLCYYNSGAGDEDQSYTVCDPMDIYRITLFLDQAITMPSVTKTEYGDLTIYTSAKPSAYHPIFRNYTTFDSVAIATLKDQFCDVKLYRVQDLVAGDITSLGLCSNAGPIIINVQKVVTSGYDFLLNGLSFDATTKISVSDVLCSQTTFVSSKQIGCKLPAGGPLGSKLPIQLVNQNQYLRTQFYYSYDAPTITSISPSVIPNEGGNITITGTNYGTVANTYVTVDDNQCIISSITATSIVCSTAYGSGMNKIVTVTVSNQKTSQSYQSLSNSLLSYNTPAISSFFPNASVLSLDDIAVVGYGYDIANTIKVYIDENPARILDIGNTYVAITVPDTLRTSNSINVRVETDGEQSSLDSTIAMLPARAYSIAKPTTTVATTAGVRVRISGEGFGYSTYTFQSLKFGDATLTLCKPFGFFIECLLGAGIGANLPLNGTLDNKVVVPSMPNMPMPTISFKAPIITSIVLSGNVLQITGTNFVPIGVTYTSLTTYLKFHLIPTSPCTPVFVNDKSITCTLPTLPSPVTNITAVIGGQESNPVAVSNAFVYITVYVDVDDNNSYLNTTDVILSNCTVRLISENTKWILVPTKNANGTFSIQVPAGNYTLTLSTPLTNVSVPAAVIPITTQLPSLAIMLPVLPRQNKFVNCDGTAYTANSNQTLTLEYGTFFLQNYKWCSPGANCPNPISSVIVPPGCTVTYPNNVTMIITPFVQGKLFFDTNTNNRIDTTESVVPNSAVTLTVRLSTGQQIVYTNTTNASGQFYFTNFRVDGAFYYLSSSRAGYLVPVTRLPFYLITTSNVPHNVGLVPLSTAGCVGTVTNGTHTLNVQYGYLNLKDFGMCSSGSDATCKNSSALTATLPSYCLATFDSTSLMNVRYNGITNMVAFVDRDFNFVYNASVDSLMSSFTGGHKWNITCTVLNGLVVKNQIVNSNTIVIPYGYPCTYTFSSTNQTYIPLYDNLTYTYTALSTKYIPFMPKTPYYVTLYGGFNLTGTVLNLPLGRIVIPLAELQTVKSYSLPTTSYGIALYQNNTFTSPYKTTISSTVLVNKNDSIPVGMVEIWQTDLAFPIITQSSGATFTFVNRYTKVYPSFYFDTTTLISCTSNATHTTCILPPLNTANPIIIHYITMSWNGLTMQNPRYTILYRVLTVTGKVYIDKNLNNVYNAGIDTFLTVPVTVRLYNQTNNVLLRSVNTIVATGQYTFADLVLNSPYYIVLVAIPGYIIPVNRNQFSITSTVNTIVTQNIGVLASTGCTGTLTLNSTTSLNIQLGTVSLNIYQWCQAPVVCKYPATSIVVPNGCSGFISPANVLTVIQGKTMIMQNYMDPNLIGLPTTTPAGNVSIVAYLNGQPTTQVAFTNSQFVTGTMNAQLPYGTWVLSFSSSNYAMFAIVNNITVVSSSTQTPTQTVSTGFFQYNFHFATHPPVKFYTTSAFGGSYLSLISGIYDSAFLTNVGFFKKVLSWKAPYVYNVRQYLEDNLSGVITTQAVSGNVNGFLPIGNYTPPYNKRIEVIDNQFFNNTFNVFSQTYGSYIPFTNRYPVSYPFLTIDSIARGVLSYYSDAPGSVVVYAPPGVGKHNLIFQWMGKQAYQPFTITYSVQYVYGYVYLDENDNDQWDSGEPAVNLATIKMGSLVTTTQLPSVMYNFTVTPGQSYTVYMDNTDHYFSAPYNTTAYFLTTPSYQFTVSYGTKFVKRIDFIFKKYPPLGCKGSVTSTSPGGQIIQIKYGNNVLHSDWCRAPQVCTNQFVAPVLPVGCKYDYNNVTNTIAVSFNSRHRNVDYSSLSPLQFSVLQNPWSYTWTVGGPNPNCTAKLKSLAGGSISTCQFSGTSYYNTGETQSGIWDVNSFGQGSQVTYKSSDTSCAGGPRTSTTHITCGTTNTPVSAVERSTPCNYDYTMKSPAACSLAPRNCEYDGRIFYGLGGQTFSAVSPSSGRTYYWYICTQPTNFLCTTGTTYTSSVCQKLTTGQIYNYGNADPPTYANNANYIGIQASYTTTNATGCATTRSSIIHMICGATNSPILASDNITSTPCNFVGYMSSPLVCPKIVPNCQYNGVDLSPLASTQFNTQVTLLNGTKIPIYYQVCGTPPTCIQKSGALNIASCVQTGTNTWLSAGQFSSRTFSLDNYGGLQITYSSGATCPNSSALRKTIVHLSCGATVAILNATENSACEYHINMTAPSACATKISNCQYNGQDFSLLAGTTFQKTFTLMDGLTSQMSFTVCGSPSPICRSNLNNQDNTAVCQFSHNRWLSTGEFNNPVWSSGVNGFQVTYQGALDYNCPYYNHRTTIHLKCDNITAVTSVVESSQCSYEVFMTTRLACVSSTPLVLKAATFASLSSPQQDFAEKPDIPQTVLETITKNIATMTSHMKK